MAETSKDATLNQVIKRTQSGWPEKNQQVTPESCCLLARAGWDKTDSGAEAVVAARAALLAGPLLRSVFLLAPGARGEQGDTGGGSTDPLGDSNPSQV